MAIACDNCSNQKPWICPWFLSPPFWHTLHSDHQQICWLWPSKHVYNPTTSLLLPSPSHHHPLCGFLPGHPNQALCFSSHPSVCSPFCCQLDPLGTHIRSCQKTLVSLHLRVGVVELTVVYQVLHCPTSHPSLCSPPAPAIPPFLTSASGHLAVAVPSPRTFLPRYLLPCSLPSFRLFLIILPKLASSLPLDFQPLLSLLCFYPQHVWEEDRILPFMYCLSFLSIMKQNKKRTLYGLFVCLMHRTVPGSQKIVVKWVNEHTN